MSTALTLTHTLLLGSYAFIVLAHTGLQERFRGRNTPVGVGHDLERLPDIWERPPRVDVVIPTYNEHPDVLAACLESLHRQDYKGDMRFLVVDDGSSNIEALLPVYRRHGQQPNWSILRWREPGNKGSAWHSNGHLRRDDKTSRDSTTMASSGRWRGRRASRLHRDGGLDTIVEPDGVSWILTPFLDGRVAAVTGRGRLEPRHQRLTGLIDDRYGLLFHHERAAQSHYAWCTAAPGRSPRTGCRISTRTGPRTSGSDSGISVHLR